ncbi:hypothetical protein SETIT_9G250100v2 [Setaria italica]|uniref:Uncharacterized protein n=1 Tax=Setaria italica TaxID=4555 RepID=A0A368SKC2_SETIT|nr:uncharacterized protein LOC101781067 [Setaria italica]RCV42872.1 hypothetical protein SETIT_9G250100v2 [Setaria italica]
MFFSTSCKIMKKVLLPGSFMISILVPSYWIQLYGKVAPFGAGIFLFIQLISVMRLIKRLNYRWCQINFKACYLARIFGIGGHWPAEQLRQYEMDDILRVTMTTPGCHLRVHAEQYRH